MEKKDKAFGLHDLKPAEGSKDKRAFRVGRGQGSGNGKTAGRGHKGAQSRSGFKFKRGFTNIFRTEYAVVNVDRIAEVFDAGTVITPELLQQRGLVARGAEKVKVLARGDVAKALTIKAHKFSGKAAEKIAAAGGSTEVL